MTQYRPIGLARWPRSVRRFGGAPVAGFPARRSVCDCLDWFAEEVENAAAGHVEIIVRRAEREHLGGCHRHCERIERVFARLVVVARTQSPRSHALPWSVTVVQLPNLQAIALPGGQVLNGEPFIDRRAQSDAALAFVPAHEMAHGIL